MKDALNDRFNDVSKPPLEALADPLFNPGFYHSRDNKHPGILERQLLKAAENGDVARVAELIKKNANIFTGNEKPLQLAAGNGHLDIVKLLLNAKGAWGHYYATLYKGHAAQKAAENGHAEVAAYLNQTLKNHMAFLERQWNRMGNPDNSALQTQKPAGPQ